MKEHPIIMSTPMVKAILDGRKTMTRRLAGINEINMTPNNYALVDLSNDLGYPSSEGSLWAGFQHHSSPSTIYYKCPYGQKGDNLWVRETWQIHDLMYDGYNGGWEAGYPLSIIPKEKPPTSTYCLFYKVDDDEDIWRPSIHMPRWASRITLEITEVRVERLQEISNTDCEKEGLDNPCGYYCDETVGHVDHQGTINNFAKLWNSLNAKRKPTKYDREHGITNYAWESNPWVWVISFKKINE